MVHLFFFPFFIRNSLQIQQNMQIKMKSWETCHENVDFRNIEEFLYYSLIKPISDKKISVIHWKIKWQSSTHSKRKIIITNGYVLNNRASNALSWTRSLEAEYRSTLWLWTQHTWTTYSTIGWTTKATDKPFNKTMQPQDRKTTQNVYVACLTPMKY